MLNGYKTYIVAFLIVVVGMLNAFGYIPTSVMETVIAILSGAGLASLRSSVAELE